MARSPYETLAQQVARRIVEARTARRITQDALAERLEMATRNLQRIESGRQNLTLGTIERIARALDEEPIALLPVGTTRFLPRGEYGATPSVVPVVALQAAAGLIRDPRSVEAEGWWIVDDPGDGIVFGCRVEGDSMEPLIPSGASALFRAPPELIGRDAVFLWQVRSRGAPDDGGTFLVKRLGGRTTLASGAVRVTLSSLNQRHPPQVFVVDEDDSLRPLARLVRVLR
jgi:transcriptional regulator with XRE-family HTH domain